MTKIFKKKIQTLYKNKPPKSNKKASRIYFNLIKANSLPDSIKSIEIALKRWYNQLLPCMSSVLIAKNPNP